MRFIALRGPYRQLVGHRNVKALITSATTATAHLPSSNGRSKPPMAYAIRSIHSTVPLLKKLRVTKKPSLAKPKSTDPASKSREPLCTIQAYKKFLKQEKRVMEEWLGKDYDAWLHKGDLPQPLPIAVAAFRLLRYRFLVNQASKLTPEGAEEVRMLEFLTTPWNMLSVHPKMRATAAALSGLTPPEIAALIPEPALAKRGEIAFGRRLHRDLTLYEIQRAHVRNQVVPLGMIPSDLQDLRIWENITLRLWKESNGGPELPRRLTERRIWPLRLVAEATLKEITKRIKESGMMESMPTLATAKDLLNPRRTQLRQRDARNAAAQKIVDSALVQHKDAALKDSLEGDVLAPLENVQSSWGPDRLAPPSSLKSSPKSILKGKGARENPVQKRAQQILLERLLGRRISSRELSFFERNGIVRPMGPRIAVRGKARGINLKVGHLRRLAKQIVPLHVARKGSFPALDASTPDHPLKKIPRDDGIPVPRLEHGLDRVLFNPSVHWLQDPASGVYNFPPQLQSIPSVKSFDFQKVLGFVPSSQDPVLRNTALKYKKRYTGSTSSLTFIFTHIYHLLSRNRRVDISPMSSAFKDMPNKFTSGMCSPGSVTVTFKDGVYAFDSGNGPDDEFGVSSRNILTWMGTMLEKYLTLPTEKFNTLLRTSVPSTETQPPSGEAYQYSESKNFVVRAQLDCVDDRLPGTGVFDIKTRAAVAIRHDRLNYELASGYQITSQHGLFESFEREYYDLIRSAMIKYNFQARIGQMDGIFVAYHNTARIFGFQYLSISDMDERLFGNRTGGDRVFAKCVELLDTLAEAITEVSPEQDVRCMFETKSTTSGMRLWITPVKGRGVTELTLNVKNLINGEEVQGRPAFDDPESDWSIEFEIKKESNTPEVRKRYVGALRRQRAISVLVLPEGVSDPSSEQIREVWENIDFGGPAEKLSKGRRKDKMDYERLRRLFKPPYPLIVETRKIAEAGRRRLLEEGRGELLKIEPPSTNSHVGALEPSLDTNSEPPVTVRPPESSR